MTALSPVSARIWDMKYRLKRPDGTPIDTDIDATFDRVARALAAGEAEPARWEARFRDVLEDFAFIPAGRILAGAGTERAVTLFNCFVMGAVPDDMGGIFDHLREAALTLQQGGGIGYDFSTIRPKGAPVRGVGADASGPLSFMDVWDSMCRTIMSAGSRRGAMMACLRCDHPDIEAFIDAKADPARLRMFNLSVLVTDGFMAALKSDAPWPLRFAGETQRVVSARALWDKIMQATYDYAEPGVIFIDRINRLNNLWYCETISATNPCGEQPLPPYGACLLGSINLAALVKHPFTPQAALDTDRLAAIAAVAVRMLDNAIDLSRYPLSAQAAEAKAKRRMGIGVTGLADALILCNRRYDSQEALAAVRSWLGTLRQAAYAASVELAQERGAFPLFDGERYLAGTGLAWMDAGLRSAVARHGIRNALLTSIAPTGTISLLADNLSSGIEPVFALRSRRQVLQPDGRRREEEVIDHALRRWQQQAGSAPLPPAFVDASGIAPAAHLRMQATAQEFVDSAISKTINLPADIPFAAFRDVYAEAYDSGCKGCTTYRPNAVTGAVLSPLPTETEGRAVTTLPSSAPPTGGGGGLAAGSGIAGGGAVVHLTQPLQRPDALPGQTYKIKWPDSDHALYITVNDILQDGRRRPFEVFINSKNMEHYAWTVALTRMISAVFRRGGDVAFVVEELKAVFDPRGGAWIGGRYVPSLLAAIGDAIASHMVAIGFMPPAAAGLAGVAVSPTEETAPAAMAAAPLAGPAASLAVAADDGLPGAENPAGAAVSAGMPGMRDSRGALAGAGRRILRQCPSCGSVGLVRQEGCDVCGSCGYSRCG